MTIAVSLKVNDGLVLAADSASTLINQDPSGKIEVINVYNNADKIFNLVKGLPIGVITWGAGNIGTASTSTLIKDLRFRLSGGDKYCDTRWHTGGDYTLQNVAGLLREFIFEEVYTPEYKDAPIKPQVGFIVAGYSSGERMAEEYQIDIVNGNCDQPRLLRPKGDSGVTWSGQLEAISRLVLGFGTGMGQVLQNNLGIPPEQVQQVLSILQQNLTAPLVIPAMPFQDAIDLAEFLVDLTVKYTRFSPGAPTVGGPIEVAAISKHEGFKWIRRKHYYNRELNREEGNARGH